MAELPAGRHDGDGGAQAGDPFAELGALFAKVDPEKPNQSLRLVVCKICGVPSGWAAIWEPGGGGVKALSDFKEGHRRSTQGSGPFGGVGHNQWYEYDINRRLESR